eukprot:UN25036
MAWNRRGPYQKQYRLPKNGKRAQDGNFCANYFSLKMFLPFLAERTFHIQSQSRYFLAILKSFKMFQFEKLKHKEKMYETKNAVKSYKHPQKYGCFELRVYFIKVFNSEQYS